MQVEVESQEKAARELHAGAMKEKARYLSLFALFERGRERGRERGGVRRRRMRMRRKIGR